MIRDEVRAWPGYKSLRAMLAPGQREDRWLKTCSPYIGWALWYRPQRERFKPETARSIGERERVWLRSAKPAGYSWRLEKLTPAQRVALGCLPKPAEAAPKQARAAA